MSAKATAIGSILAIGLAATFPALIAASGLSDDGLRVTVPARRPFLVRENSSSAYPAVTVTPSLGPEALFVAEPPSKGPGLDFRTWTVTYSHRWEQQVAVPVLTGPFVPEGQDTCGYVLRLGAGLFDTSGAGAGLQTAFRRELDDFFARPLPLDAGQRLTLPRLRDARLRVVPAASVFAISVDLDLEGGARFSISFRAHLVEEGGAPALRRAGDVETSSNAATWHTLLVTNASAMQALLEEHLAKVFPFPKTIEDCTIVFPELEPRSVRLDATALGADLVSIGLSLRLVDGTRFEVHFTARVRDVQGALQLERVGDPETPTWTGKTFAQAQRCGVEKGSAFGFGVGLAACVFFFPVGCAAIPATTLGGAAIGKNEAEARATRESKGVVSDQIDDGLSRLNAVVASKSREAIVKGIDKALADVSLGLRRLREPWAPLPDQPRNTIALRLAGSPRVSPTGIVIPLCARVAIGAPRRDADVPGPVDQGAVPPYFPRELAAPSNSVELRMNANGMNQALYFLWQSGVLKTLGTSSRVLDALPDEIKGLAFDVTGFDPGLPPTVTNATDARIGLTLGDVGVGTWNHRRVVAHAQGMMEIRPHGDDLKLSASVNRLMANCTDAPLTGTTFTPCLSDVVPAIRDKVGERPFTFSVGGLEILNNLPSVTFRGITAHLFGFQAETSGSPATLDLRVHARLVGPDRR